MTPILMQDGTVICFLADALTCVVTEERNGIYELSMTFPVVSEMFSQLRIDRLIKAKPNDTADLQLFRIYSITKPINGIITVKAEHISYALSSMPVARVKIKGTADAAIDDILGNVNLMMSTEDTEYSTPFRVSVCPDMDAVHDFAYEVGSARGALGGTEGSVLDVYGGEYEFDNYVIRLHKNRGTHTGIVIAYGKNMTDIKATTSLDNAYTGLFPYAKRNDQLYYLHGYEFDDNMHMITFDPVIAVENKSGIEDRVLLRDFSSEFEDDEEITNKTLLAKATAFLERNNINNPEVNIVVSFVHLWQSPDYAEYAPLEKVSLCDWVTAQHEILGINVEAQVIKTVYNTLSERYDKIELGSARANFGDTIRQATHDLNAAIDAINTSDEYSKITQEYKAAILRATQRITGYSGGYVRFNPYLKEDGETLADPQEILIMDSNQIVNAQKLWRWNIGGLGYSNTGYNGEYKTAITMDGEIVADFITTGKLNASLIQTGTLNAKYIKAGILSDKNNLFSFNLDTGEIIASNMHLSGGTIQIGNASYYTYIANGEISQHLAKNTSGASLTGGLVITGYTTESGEEKWRETIYFNEENSKAEGVAISKRREDGNFAAIAVFTDAGAAIFRSTSITGNLSASGWLSVNGSFTTIGNADINGSLTANGRGQFNNGLTVYESSTFYGSVSFENSVSFANSSFTLNSLSFSGNGGITSKLIVSGATSLNSTLYVKSGTNLASTLNVAGKTTLLNDLIVSGQITSGSLATGTITATQFDIQYQDGGETYTTQIYAGGASFGFSSGSNKRQAIYGSNGAYFGTNSDAKLLYDSGMLMLIGSGSFGDYGTAVSVDLGNNDTIAIFATNLDGKKGLHVYGVVGAEKFLQGSTQEIKQNIKPAPSAISAIRNSTIYQYNIAADGESNIISVQSEQSDDPVSYGFVIERETPEEIISPSRKAIDLYSMASLNWKATQEILARLERLEASQNA